MISYRLVAILCIFTVVMVGGCASSTTTNADPITGSWTYHTSSNGSTVTSTLVFDPNGNFNGYMAGLLTLSGHWTKSNDTAYTVYYNNKAQLFIMSGDKTRISESTAPQVIFTKQ